MYTDVTFSMDGQSSAPHRVGALLVPQAAQYYARWVHRGERSYVTLMVNTSIVDDMVRKVCDMHPSVRCISRDEVLPAPNVIQGSAS
jgi:hypothetical protein